MAQVTESKIKNQGIIPEIIKRTIHRTDNTRINDNPIIIDFRGSLSEIRKNNNIDKARELFYKYFYLTNSMFYETNPIPVKTSLKLMGKITGEVRLPLFELQKSNLDLLTEDLKRYNLI